MSDPAQNRSKKLQDLTAAQALVEAFPELAAGLSAEESAPAWTSYPDSQSGNHVGSSCLLDKPASRIAGRAKLDDA